MFSARSDYLHCTERLFFYTEPNSFIHSSYFLMSASDTDLNTLSRAPLKSFMLTGNSSFSFGRFLICSGDSPSIHRLITIIEASLRNVQRKLFRSVTFINKHHHSRVSPAAENLRAESCLTIAYLPKVAYVLDMTGVVAY